MASEDNGSQTTNSSKEETKQCGKQTGNRYFGALVLIAAIIPLPFLAALITIIAYLSPSPPPAGAFFDSLGPDNMVVLLGLIITLVLWVLLAIPCMRFATAKGAKPSDYEGLHREYEVLKKQLQVVKCEQTTQDTCKSATPTVQYKAAIADIDSNLECIDKILECNGLTWWTTGYVSLWDRINKADEAIIDVLPCETVLESAKYEELRLKNSLVPDCEDYLKLLHQAIQTLSSDLKPSTAGFGNLEPSKYRNKRADHASFLRLEINWLNLYGHLCRQSSEQNQDADLQQSKAANPPSPSTANNGQVSHQTVQEARADIRKVKAAIHNFTNDRWDGLIRVRNQFMGTAFLSAFFTYILVVIAILVAVPQISILEAMVYYFLGAIVGLFGRLVDERNIDRVTDDYGLSMARVIVTPGLSGLAALVGVWLANILSISIGSISTTPIHLATRYAQPLNIYPQNLLFAAIFGYAPNMVISILQSNSEKIKGQLKSASPSDQKSGNGK